MKPGQAPQLQEGDSQWVQISDSMQVLVNERVSQQKGAVAAAAEIGQEISTGVQEVLVDIFTRDVYGEWDEKGMLVQRLSLSAHEHRIVEPDNKDAKRIVEWVVSTLKTVDVHPEDMILIQLPDGFLMEIPRMNRKIIVRRGSFAISSPTEMRSYFMQDDRQGNGGADRMSRMREALFYDFYDTALTGKNIPRKKINLENREKLRACIVEKYPTNGSFFAMQNKEKHSDEMAMILRLAAQAYGITSDPLESIEAFRELGGEIYWRNKEIDVVTPAEQERNMRIRAEYEQRMIAAIRSKFPVSDLCYMEPEEARRIRVDRRRLVDIAEELGIRDAGHDDIQWWRFAAKVYGDDNPIVQRAGKSLTMSA